jgi:Protein of unknown function (DUF4089)
VTFILALTSWVPACAGTTSIELEGEGQESMTKRPKSLRKSKSKKSRAPAATSARGKGKRPRTKQASRDPLDDFVETAARALNLKVQQAWKGPVKANLATTFALAASLADFPLPDDAEPAPIFLA